MSRAISLALQGSALIPGLSYDVVGVFTQDNIQVFQKAKAIKVFVRRDSELPEHPLERGSQNVDHRIFKPVEVEMPLLIVAFNIKEVYQQIYQLYKSNAFLSVQTKVTTLTNMLISRMPHEESSNPLNSALINLNLKEITLSTAVETAKNPANTPRKDRGNQQPAPATPAQMDKGTVLLDLFGSAV